MKHLPAVGLISVLLSASGTSAVADPSQLEGLVRADAHAPLGVMGEHVHAAGEWMLSYRYMRMDMSGNRTGTDDLTPQEVQQSFGFNVVPTKMPMGMHMFGLMYAPTDDLTLVFMAPYVNKSMDHVMLMPNGMVMGEFTTRSEGFGDVKAMGLFRAHKADNQEVILRAGVSLPTGSVTERDDTPAMANAKLPYPMQIGSGTYDLLPGALYKDRADDLSWGAQYAGTIRLGENDEGYTRGDKHALTAWTGYQWAPAVSTSLRLLGTLEGHIEGADPILNPNMVQTADPHNHGGKSLELSFGVNLVGQRGAVRGHRIAAEFALPLYHKLNGPQLEADWRLTVGWQYAFGG